MNDKPDFDQGIEMIKNQLASQASTLKKLDSLSVGRFRFFLTRAVRLHRLSNSGDGISFCNLEPLGKELTCEVIRTNLKHLLDIDIKNKKLAKEIDSEKKLNFDFADGICKELWKVFKREVIMIWIFDMLAVACVYLIAVALKSYANLMFIYMLQNINYSVDQVQVYREIQIANAGISLSPMFLITQQHQANFDYMTQVTLGDIFTQGLKCVGAYLFFRCLEFYLDIRKSSLCIKIGQCLAIFLIDKLEHTDQRFLNQIQTHVLERLFFTDSESIMYSLTQSPVIGRMALFFIFIICYYWTDSVGVRLLVYLAIVCLNAGGLVLLIAYRRLVKQAYKLMQAKRSRVYELVTQFKTIKLRNLRQQFYKLILNIRHAKVNNTERRLQILIGYSALIEYTTIFLLLLNLIRYGYSENFSCPKNIQQRALLVEDLQIYVSNCCCFFFILLHYESSWQNCFDYLRTKQKRNKSIEFYCKFLNHRFTKAINLSPNSAETIPGSVVLKNCTATIPLQNIFNIELENMTSAEEANLKKPIEEKRVNLDVFTTKGGKTSILKTSNKQKEKEKKKVKSKRLFTTVKFAKPEGQSISLNQPEVNQPVQAIDHDNQEAEADVMNVTCTIQPGEKVALYGDIEQGCSAMIQTLLGCGKVTEGHIFKSGRVAYLNFRYPTFIASKTIYENITMKNVLNQEKYTKIMKALNLNLSMYNGEDYYQVNENGSNLNKLDGKLINLARLLYIEAEIFVIENFLTENDVLQDQLDLISIFKDLLLKKTVIVSTRNKTCLRLIDRVLTFRENRLIDDKSSSELMTLLESESLFNFKKTIDCGESSEEELENPMRQFTLKFRSKNVFLVKNLNFDHEHMILKRARAIKQKAEEILKDSNPIQKLTYGVYLTERRKELGRTLKTDNYMEHLGTFSKTIGSIFRMSKLRKTCYVVLFIVCVLCLSYICLGFAYSFDFALESLLTGNTKGLSSGLTVRILAIGLVFGMLIIGSTVLYLMIQRTISRNLRSFHNELLKAIADNDIGDHSRYRHFFLTRIMTTCYSDLETEGVSLVVKMVSNLLWGAAAVLYLNVIFPLYILPGLLIGLLIGYKYGKQVVKTLMTIIPIKLKILDRQSELVYDFAKLLLNARNTDSIKELVSLMYRVQNHLMLASYRTSYDITFTLRLINIAVIVVILLIVSAMSVTSLKGYTLQKPGFVVAYFWAMVISIIIAHASIKFYLNFLQLIDLLSSLMVIHNFMQDHVGKLEQRRQIEVYGMSDMRHLKTANMHKYAIIMKRVYLTLGKALVLKDLNFRVRYGSRIVLLGCDGVGRSSIFNLIAGTCEPDQSIEDCNEVMWILDSKYSESTNMRKTHEKIDMLESNPILFEGTVRNNLDPEGVHSDDDISSVFKFMVKKKELKDRWVSTEGLQKAESVENIRNEGLLQLKPIINFEKKSFASNRFLSAKIDADRISISQPYNSGDLNDIYDSDKALNAKNFQSTQYNFDLELDQVPEVVEEFSEIKKSSEISLDLKFSTLRTEILAEGVKVGPIKETKLAKTSILNLNKNNLQDSAKLYQESVPLSYSASEGKPQYLQRVVIEKTKGTTKKVEITQNQADSKKVFTRKMTGKGESLPPTRIVKDLPVSHASVRGDKLIPDLLNKASSIVSRKSSIRDSSSPVSQWDKGFAKIENITNLIESAIDSKSPISNTGLSPSEFNHSVSPTMKPMNQSMIIQDIEINTIKESKPSQDSPQSKKDEKFEDFLNLRVNYGGSNLCLESRRLINACRCLLKKPKILLLWEEGMSFHEGIESMIDKVFDYLKETTILAIGKDSRNMLAYDKVFLIDSGSVADKGNPVVCLNNKDSLIHNFVKETDPEVFKILRREYKSYKDVSGCDSFGRGWESNTRGEDLFIKENYGKMKTFESQQSFDVSNRFSQSIRSQLICQRNRTLDAYTPPPLANTFDSQKTIKKQTSVFKPIFHKQPEVTSLKPPLESAYSLANPIAFHSDEDFIEQDITDSWQKNLDEHKTSHRSAEPMTSKLNINSVFKNKFKPV